MVRDLSLRCVCGQFPEQWETPVRTAALGLASEIFCAQWFCGILAARVQGMVYLPVDTEVHVLLLHAAYIQSDWCGSGEEVLNSF